MCCLIDNVTVRDKSQSAFFALVFEEDNSSSKRLVNSNGLLAQQNALVSVILFRGRARGKMALVSMRLGCQQEEMEGKILQWDWGTLVMTKFKIILLHKFVKELYSNCIGHVLFNLITSLTS